MRAVSYEEPGSSDVLRLTERAVPEPGPGEVRVRVAVSGVNPTDWKSRSATGRSGLVQGGQVPNQDGAGVIDSVGAGVDAGRVGRRVWIWEAAWQRADGTAQEYVVLPEHQAVDLPDGASLDLGAGLGIPFLTAHRCLTVGDGGPTRLSYGALDGCTVLVAGGAGAVGNAAIQLARWAGASVLSTVSSARKATLARAAGAHEVIDYTTADVAASVRRRAPDGVHIVVEVAPATNAALDTAIAAPDGVIATYSDDGGAPLTLTTRALMTNNVRWQFVLVYTVPGAAKAAAVADVEAALAAGALGVGEEHGLPLHRFPLERTAEAHDAVQGGAVGKVLVDVGPG